MPAKISLVVVVLLLKAVIVVAVIRNHRDLVRGIKLGDTYIQVGR